MCANFTELLFVDLDTGDIVTLTIENLAISGSNITFSSDELTHNRQYIVDVRATNAAGTATSNYRIS